MNEKKLDNLPFVGIEKYWIKNFKNKDWTWWWINTKWKILKDWCQYCAPFFWWFWRFRINNKEGWINTKWEIIKDECSYCGDFNGWYNGFLKKGDSDSDRKFYIEDWKRFTVNDWECFEWFAVFNKDGVWWRLDNEGKILAEWFKHCDDFYEWFAAFQDNEWKCWWIDKNWKVWKNWYWWTKKFNEWFAVFTDKKWWEWWMSKTWNVLKEGCEYCSMFKNWEGEFSLEEDVDDLGNEIEFDEEDDWDYEYCNHSINKKWEIEYNCISREEWNIQTEQNKLDMLDEYVSFFSWVDKKYITITLQDGTVWWVDKSGKVFASWFRSCWDFHNGFAVFRRFNNTFGWIDENGNILSEWYSLCFPFWKSQDDYLRYDEYKDIDEFDTENEDYKNWRLLWYWEDGAIVRYINTDWSIYDTSLLKYDRFSGEENFF